MEKSEIKSFQENGFLIVENSIDSTILNKARDSYNQLYLKAKKGKYPYVRVYDDYSNKPNLAGIEMVFNPEIIDQNIINLLNQSKILDYAKKILGNDIKLTLSRYHLTENISHAGPAWERHEPRVSVLSAYSHLATHWHKLNIPPAVIAALPREKQAYFRDTWSHDFSERPVIENSYERFVADGSDN